jgi:O-antigen ligase
MKNYYIKNFSFFVLFLFPISVLLRSAALNLYFVVMSLFFIFLSYKKKIFLLGLKNAWAWFFLVIIAYLVLISFFSFNMSASLKSAVSQLRFIFFVLFLGCIAFTQDNIKKFIFCTSILILLTCFDTLLQYFNGKDLFGFEPAGPVGSPYRLSGPFGDELIVGTYIGFIAIPLVSYFFFNFSKFSKIEKFYNIFFLAVCFFSVLLAGERIAFLIFVSSLLIIALINFGIKRTFFFSLIIFTVVFFFVQNNSSTNNRATIFYDNIVNFKNSDHYKLFSSAYNIWNQNKFFGVGLKNYREACNIMTIDPITKQNTLCSTHPHNTYLEILSETGLFGLMFFIVFFLLIFLYIVKNMKLINSNFKGLFYGSSIILLSYVWPIRSHGSFFSTFNASFFWFNLGIIYLLINFSKNKKIV